MTVKLRDQSLKQRWVDALRSGEYQQTTGVLHRTHSDEDDEPVGHCCLGVLCDLLDFVKEDDDGDARIFRFNGYSRYADGTPIADSVRIPREVLDDIFEGDRSDWVLDEDLSDYGRDQFDDQKSVDFFLISLNDGDEEPDAPSKSFDFIADWIEANL